jgi:nitrile hydratase subunit beta
MPGTAACRGLPSPGVDGIHDMGGMHGFGPIDAEAGEPVFHAPWEGRTFALMLVTAALGLREGSLRPHIEAMDPGAYLASDYYERWGFGVERGLVAAGTLTTDEIDARAATVEPGDEPTRSEATSPGFVEALPGIVDSPVATSGVAADSAFSVGDQVRVRRMAPEGHHRCPRYVRGATGTITHIAGGWPHPGDDTPEPICTVRFPMRALWGDDAEPGHLYIDLWERYLA